LIVVLDTNVVVRAAFRRNTDSSNLLARARRGEFQTAISTPTIRELETTFRYQHVERRLIWSEAERDAFVRRYVEASIRLEPRLLLSVVRDPRDNRFVELAIEADAAFLVTTDKDLLDLDQYQGVGMVTEAQFVAILRDAV
jgi:uncharacterized protein